MSPLVVHVFAIVYVTTTVNFYSSLVEVRWSRGVLPLSAIVARSAQTTSECFNSFTHIRWKIVNLDKSKSMSVSIHTSFRQRGCSWAHAGDTAGLRVEGIRPGALNPSLCRRQRSICRMYYSSRLSWARTSWCSSASTCRHQRSPSDRPLKQHVRYC